MSLATAEHTNTLEKETPTASFVKAKSLFIRVLLALEPAQYALLRVQRYNYFHYQPNIFSIFYQNEMLKKHNSDVTSSESLLSMDGVQVRCHTHNYLPMGNHSRNLSNYVPNSFSISSSIRPSLA